VNYLQQSSIKEINRTETEPFKQADILKPYVQVKSFSFFARRRAMPEPSADLASVEAEESEVAS
jgi:hypothetical protein